VTIAHFDMLIVGAGLSGIGRATICRLAAPAGATPSWRAATPSAAPGTCSATRHPRRFRHVHARLFVPAVGGSQGDRGRAVDSQYVRDTAREYGIDRRIRFGHQVKRACWSSQDARWTVEGERRGAREPVRLTCDFLFVCGGYYKYAEGYTPDFPGMQRFAGRIVHPQKWTDDIDYAGKRVVVIGSGATAVTLVPVLAKRAAHVTMLQRSPTWVVARPSADDAAIRLRRWLPSMLAYGITRWKRVLLQQYFFNLCRRNPARARKLIWAECARISDPATTSSGTSRRATTPGNSGCAWCPTRICSAPSAATRRR